MQRRKRGRPPADDGPVERQLVLVAKGVSKEQLRRIATASGVQVSVWRQFEAVMREAEPLLYQEALQVAGEPRCWIVWSHAPGAAGALQEPRPCPDVPHEAS